MRTQHSFCTQQLRYVGITRIVILLGLNLCARSRENSFQEVLKAVLFGVGVYLQQLTFWLFCGSPIRVSTTFILCVKLILFALARISNNVFLFWGEVGNFRSSRVVPRERARSPNSESCRVKLLRDGCACVARVKLGMRNVRRVHLTDIWSWCWKPSSLLSNVHFRNTTKKLQYKFFALNFVYLYF